MATSLVIPVENDQLSVQLIPAEGGRIASLKSRSTGLEFLTQSTRTVPSPPPNLYALFQSGPCAGIEECLPSVGPGSAHGGYVPDHGDYWQLPWRVLANTSDRLHISADGFSRTLRFSKDLSLDGNTLRVQYRVENTGSAPQSFLYACHPLFAVSAGDRILLPPGVSELTLQYSRNDRIGLRGSNIAWPVTASGLYLDITGEPDAGTAEMFYTARLNEGICGIWRHATGQVLEVSFDTSALPFLGLWICHGGWPEQSERPQQYAVALEPTTSPCNTLAEAQQQGSALALAAAEAFEWQIRFAVIADARHSRLLF
ncbi:MAG TPA: aldose epimerase [Acidobacteriaceae bacterium]|jgi:galactose mutarotase-like enzyme